MPKDIIFYTHYTFDITNTFTGIKNFIEVFGPAITNKEMIKRDEYVLINPVGAKNVKNIKHYPQIPNIKVNSDLLDLFKQFAKMWPYEYKYRLFVDVPNVYIENSDECPILERNKLYMIKIDDTDNYNLNNLQFIINHGVYKEETNDIIYNIIDIYNDLKANVLMG